MGGLRSAASMGSAAPRHRHSYRDYLALEQASNVRHEYLAGEIYAMAGGTPEHAALAAAVISFLHAALRDGPCRVFASDLRVRVVATGLATYPDVVVVCGQLERDSESDVTALNPTLLVEILSDGTEDYDRGEKFEHYRRIPSLKEYVMVSHRGPSVEVWRAGAGGWSRREARSGEKAVLESVGCDLDVDALYREALR